MWKLSKKMEGCLEREYVLPSGMASARSVHLIISGLLHEIFSHVYMGANRLAGHVEDFEVGPECADFVICFPICK